MQTGLDRLLDESRLRKKVMCGRVGVLCHPASVTRQLVHIGDAFASWGVHPSLYFGPEHGFGGEAQDMLGVADAVDRHGVPLRSLYGHTFSSLSPQADDIDRLDLLVIDLQDVGARYYTFVWTALLALRVAARCGVRTLILDRPNPIGTAMHTLEGRLQADAFLSFVGLRPAPVRHALTLGQLVAACASQEGIGPGALEVVGVRGVRDDSDAWSWNRPFVPPSPNMPHIDTALVYPGGCLLEGTNLSEGRGTTRPFEVFGAPWVDGSTLARNLAELALPGCVARPVSFVPMFHKFAGEACGGVQIHVLDRARFRPMRTYLAAIALCARMFDAFRFRTETYEFVDDVPAIDLLLGNRTVREMVQQREPIEAICRVGAEATDEEFGMVRRAREAADAYLC